MILFEGKIDRSFLKWIERSFGSTKKAGDGDLFLYEGGLARVRSRLTKVSSI